MCRGADHQKNPALPQSGIFHAGIVSFLKGMALQSKNDGLITGLIFHTGGCPVQVAAIFGTVPAMPITEFDKLIVPRPPQRHVMPKEVGAGAAAEL